MAAVNRCALHRQSFYYSTLTPGYSHVSSHHAAVPQLWLYQLSPSTQQHYVTVWYWTLMDSWTGSSDCSSWQPSAVLFLSLPAWPRWFGDSGRYNSISVLYSRHRSMLYCLSPGTHTARGRWLRVDWRPVTGWQSTSWNMSSVGSRCGLKNIY